VSELWQPVETLYENNDASQSRPDIDTLIETFLKIKTPSKVIFAIDALDEASKSTRSNLFPHLSKLAEAGFRIFFTSRPDVDLRQFRNQAIVMDIQAQNEDLEMYVTKHLQESENVQDVLEGYDQSIAKQIVKLIVGHAAGM